MDNKMMKSSCGSCCRFVSKKGLKFGMAFGVTNAIFMLALAWAGWFWGYGLPLIEQSASLYHGYAADFWGGVVGALWGFLAGFIYGYIFGIVVKCMSGCCCCKSCSAPEVCELKYPDKK